MPEAMSDRRGTRRRPCARRRLPVRRPARRNAVSPYLGVTIDQIIAKKYGQDTILSSIQLGIEDPETTAIATGVTAAHTRTPSPGLPPHSRFLQKSIRASPSSAVRRRHEPGRAAGRTKTESQHPGFGHARAWLIQEGSRRGRPGPARHLPGKHSRNRAANSDCDR